MCKLTHRFREQARSHTSSLPYKLALTQARCYKGYTLNRATVSCSDPAICAKSWPAVSV